MRASSSCSTSPNDPRPLLLASDLRQRLAGSEGDVCEAFTAVYGADPALHRERARAAVNALDRFLEAFGDSPCALYRAPARLSLNPHCDHQGAWVPYGLHCRELLAAIAPADDDRIEIANVDPAYAPLLGFGIREEIERDPGAWAEGWFRYIEAPGVVDEVRRLVDPKQRPSGRTGTVNYVKAAALRFAHVHPGAPRRGLRIALNGNITQGGGQSSSSALVVTTTLALTDLQAASGGPPPDRRLLAEQCGEAEWYVGTRGGSGDHAAMLLGSAEGLTHLCFRAPFGIRGVRRSAFPAGYQLIVANSQTRSEKSAEEKRLFNRGIFAYRFAFLALKEEMAALGLADEMVQGTESLGDLHAGRLAPADLYRLLLRLPETISPACLADRFPRAFGPAARGCFGTARLEELPAAIPLRGAAMYGLGRVDRGCAMPDLLDGGTAEAMAEFGRLLTITHDGDRLFRDSEPYMESRQRLSDGWLSSALLAVEEGQERPLRDEPGFYGASIAALDQMVDIALRTEGVLGAGLMGAGGGGYVLVLAREGSLDRVRAALEREYYGPQGKDPDVEAWRSTGPAGRLL